MSPRYILFHRYRTFMDPNADKQWFAIRVTYSRELTVKAYFEASSIECFVPMRYTLKIQRGKKRRVLEPVIHNLLFVHISKTELDRIKTTMGIRLPIRYMMQTDNGKRIPIVVPDDQMRHFMAVTATYDEQLLYLDPAEINFQQGDLVRITQGIFTGVVGRFLRIKGGRSRRGVVSVQGVMAVATAALPASFVEKIE